MTKESEIEREAIVRWLREDATQLRATGRAIDYCQAEGIEECADAIERGDHLKERG